MPQVFQSVLRCSQCHKIFRRVSGCIRHKCSGKPSQRVTACNKQMVAALWRALSDSDVKKAGNSRGVWLPLTKARLNAAYTKVFGL